jgi:hypothetical protein
LARHERGFFTAEAPLSIDELLTLLADGSKEDRPSREDAIACYLSGGDGWRDAAKRVGGAFAEQLAGLRDRKVD